MMPSPDLRIPPSQKSAIRIILDSDQARLDALLNAMKALPPSMFLSSSAEYLADNADIKEKEAVGLLLVISSLFQLQEQPGFVAENLEAEVLKAVRSDEEIAASDEQLQQLDHFLTESLALGETLGVASKAWSVARDSEHTYCYSRILTDLRPVFRPRSDDPAAFVLLHNLKIAYHEGDGVREFFVALTQSDIESLSQVLNRARKKGESLKASVKATELPTLESE